MKRRKFCMPFQLVLSFLVLAVILTLSPAVSWSKYVWQDNIKITLKVNYSGQSITSNLSVFPDVDYTLEGTGIRIETAEIPGQWILAAEDGYVLPESIIVKVGEAEYTVYTDGQNNPEGISFISESGTLTIADFLLMDCEGTVIIIADGVLVLDQTNPSEDGEPIEDGEPAEGDEPAGNGEPVGDDEPAGNGEPAEDDGLAGNGEPTEDGKPAGDSELVEGREPENGVPTVDSLTQADLTDDISAGN